MKKIDTKILRETALDIIAALIGSLLVAGSVSIFLAPNDIAPGGISGLATALAHISPFSVGAWTLLLNIPLLLCAWRKMGTRLLVFTIIATVMLSVFIELTSAVTPYTNNPLLASVIGGAICGLGVGLLFLRNISTGGTDLLALILKKILPNISSGMLMLFADVLVVAIAVYVFKNIEVALHSTISIIVCSKVVDAMAQGVDYSKVIYIVTDKGDSVLKELNKLDRGCTVIPAAGGYTMNDKQFIITVTRRNVLAQTLKVIKWADPRSFLYVVDSTEVHGEGFKMVGE